MNILSYFTWSFVDSVCIGTRDFDGNFQMHLTTDCKHLSKVFDLCHTLTYSVSFTRDGKRVQLDEVLSRRHREIFFKKISNNCIYGINAGDIYDLLNFLNNSAAFFTDCAVPLNPSPALSAFIYQSKTLFDEQADELFNAFTEQDREIVAAAVGFKCQTFSAIWDDEATAKIDFYLDKHIAF